MYRFRDTLPIDISEQTISGDLVTIENPEEMGVIDSLSVSLSPIQDLHGYDKPWVGGAGKNKCPYFPSTTTRGVTFTVNSDGSVTANGTATGGDATVEIILDTANVYGDMYFNGAYGGSPSTYNAYMFDATEGSRPKRWNGTTASDNGYQNFAEVKIVQGHRTRFVLRVMNGQTVNNVKFYPMICAPTETSTAYEPYSNICPISGRTEVVTSVSPYEQTEKHTITGKNLYNAPNNQNGVLVPCHIENGVSVVASCSSNGAGVRYYNSAQTQIDYWTLTLQANGRYYRSFTASGGIEYVEFYGANSTDYMIEVGASTPSDYEPYGYSYTTPLGRTVYGGTLDVVSGELVVDRAMVDLGTLNWGYSGGFFRITNLTNFKRPSSNSAVVNAISSAYSAMSWDAIQRTSNGAFAVSAGSDKPIFCNTEYSDADAFKTAMNGVQLCYELATPQTYQLTPQQIDLLLGTNHLWSDGEISVVWHKDLTKGRILPTEAVSINGQYIENVLDGYRTLYTKGRESLGAELNTYSVGTADGEKFKNKRYPAREITVGFQLIADTAEEFRERFTNLNNLLSLDEADFIFNDETDKFFSGYPIMNAEVEAGQNSVKGEWKIYCAYPFKRSIAPITLTMADATVTDTTATFTIDYKGARPSRPVLRAKFAGAKSSGTSSEDGDCGFVAFMDGEENIVQLGNPDVLDLDEYASAETLINKEFVNVSDWTRTGGHTYKGTVTGSVSTSDTVDAFWNGGVGQTQSYAKPTYGSGTGLHGSILWKNTAGAVNFTLNAVHRLCVNNSNETGVFEVGAYNHSTGKMVAGFVIDKSGNGTTGVVRYIVNSKQVGTDQIDLSYYNNHFGYCNRTPVYVQQTYYDPVQQTYKVQVKTKKKKKKKKYVTKSRTVWVARTRTVQNGWNYTQSNLNSSIEKEGSYVYIQVGNLPMRTFNVPDVEEMIAHDASVFMGTYGTALHTNMIHSLLFRRETGAVFAEQPNVFTAGDIVEADCNEATVYIYRDGSIGGHLEPQYGALGNDWEDFLLTSGTNVIRATWSEWVNPTYKPQIEIEYNEVFI